MIKNAGGKACLNMIKTAFTSPLDLLNGGNNKKIRYSDSRDSHYDEQELKRARSNNGEKVIRLSQLLKWTGLSTKDDENLHAAHQEKYLYRAVLRLYEPLAEPVVYPAPTTDDLVVTISIKELGIVFPETFLKKRLPNEKIYNIELQEAIDHMTFEHKRELLRRIQTVRMEYEDLANLKVNLEVGTYQNIFIDEKGRRYMSERSLALLDMIQIPTDAFKGYRLNIKRCDVPRVQRKIHSVKDKDLILEMSLKKEENRKEPPLTIFDPALHNSKKKASFFQYLDHLGSTN
ncbi:hypothetical protein WICPIJ_000801 [Wickerhamomyces pijperi]|uniref:Uncharacterized protein n=1 Tax=Wickerhamomyces pijperi TaxID=599730 RepID=A0A9P8QF12_WICPI|nr:hypothetical protein WICPIJ_000801 [Wickerhamomyces pijperi]